MQFDPEADSVHGSSTQVLCRFVPLEKIAKPGAYVCYETGDLIRVVHGGTSWAEAGLIEADPSKRLSVARISEDPYVPISEARIAAANLDVEVAF